VGRRKTQKELIEVLWESRYGTKKAPPSREEEDAKPDAPPPAAYGARPAPAPVPVAEEEIDLARLEGGEWEGLPDLVPDPIPRESTAKIGEEREAEESLGMPELTDQEPVDEEAGEPAGEEVEEEPDTIEDAEERTPPPAPALPRPRRPAPTPAGPTPLRRLTARLAGAVGGAGKLVKRSFSASTIGEFFSKSVEVRVGTIAIVFAGIVIFGFLCFLLGQGTRSRDDLARIDDETRLLMPEKTGPPPIRNASEKTPAPVPKRTSPGPEAKTGGPPAPDTKRVQLPAPPAPDLSWTIQVTSWAKKGEAKDKGFVEKLQQGLGVSPVWSEESATRVFVYAGKYASEQDARADLQKIKAARVQGFLSFQDAYPFKKTRSAQAAPPGAGR